MGFHPTDFKFNLAFLGLETSTYELSAQDRVGTCVLSVDVDG